MKKKNGLTLLVCLAVLGLLFLLNPLKIRSVDIKYHVSMQNSDSIQLFYADMNQEYSEEESYTDYLQTGVIGTYSKSIGAQCNYIRLDIGTTVNRVRMRYLTVNYGGLSETIDVSSYITTRDISSVIVTNNSMEIYTEGNDPYIIFDISDQIHSLKQRYQSFIIAMYLFVTVIFSVFFYIQYEYFMEILVWGKNIVQDRKVIIKLAKNDINKRLSDPYLGITWAFVQPIIMVIIYVFVFKYGFGVESSIPEISYFVWVVTGIIPWFFFQEAWLNTTNSVAKSQHPQKNEEVKTSILPLVKIISVLFSHPLFILIAAILILLNGIGLSIYLIQVLYYVCCMIILITGLSSITTALIPYVKDMGQIVSRLLQIGMWLTPIMWDVSTMESAMSKIAKLNPMYYIVTGYRDSFYNQIWFFQRPGLTLYFWLVVILILLIGIYVSKKLERQCVK